MGDHIEILIAEHGNSIDIVNYKDLPLIQYEMEHKPSIRQSPISSYSGTNSYEPLLLFKILCSGIPLFHGTTLWNSFIHYPHSNFYYKDYCRSCVFIIKNGVKCLQNHTSIADMKHINKANWDLLPKSEIILNNSINNKNNRQNMLFGCLKKQKSYR